MCFRQGCRAASGLSPYGPQGRDKDELPKDFRPLHVRHVYASMLISSARLTFTASKAAHARKPCHDLVV
ncbi:hypothetical protein KL86DES1_21762 [uncultured Desulfovibrio sp.]|uniref:Uncharacterized protein n=1 Tax=uncultured Desulfovibrio sp. TaxID=167968 RepID=A0A212L9Z2_9BACT|nr:hypothetical protein KL86DES1_21762 [uncultured Desulfovibrio sp.]VZH34663.1 conserved protein of unknown function [Desulfovibrio sp. 86]